MKGDRSGDDVADSASRDARILLQIIARPTNSWVEGYTQLLDGPSGEQGGLSVRSTALRIIA